MTGESVIASLVFVVCQPESYRGMIQTESQRVHVFQLGHYKSSYTDLRLLPDYLEPHHQQLTSIFSTSTVIPKTRLSSIEMKFYRLIILYPLACACLTLGYLVTSSHQTSHIHNGTKLRRGSHGCEGLGGACGLLNRSLPVGSIQGFCIAAMTIMLGVMRFLNEGD
jgi:hypothetical protein